jgi:hypothetical protein
MFLIFEKNNYLPAINELGYLKVLINVVQIILPFENFNCLNAHLFKTIRTKSVFVFFIARCAMGC